MFQMYREGNIYYGFVHFMFYVWKTRKFLYFASGCSLTLIFRYIFVDIIYVLVFLILKANHLL